MQRRRVHDLSGKTIVSTNVILPFRFIVICVNTDVSEGGTVVNKKKVGNRSDPRLLLLTQQVSRREDDLSRPYRGWNLLHFLLHLPSPSVSFVATPSEDKTWPKIPIFQFAKSRRRLTILEPIQIHTHTHTHKHNGTDLSIHGRSCSLQIRKCFMRYYSPDIAAHRYRISCPLPFCPK